MFQGLYQVLVAVGGLDYESGINPIPRICRVVAGMDCGNDSF
jgi:hypothetical protein